MSGALELWTGDGEGREAWLAALAAWPEREVFAHPDYIGLFTRGAERAACLRYQDAGGQVLYPVMLRDLRETPFWSGEAAYDAIPAPFGYGGPFVQGAADDAEALALAGRFFEAYGVWARDTGLVAEFMTFSPKDERAWPYPGEVAERAPTVVRRLDLTADALWMDYKGSVRTDVKAAARNGVTVEVDLDGRHAADFLRVYEATMDRREAAATYHMDAALLEAIVTRLGGWFAFFHARHEGEIVSSELVLLSGDSSFFFRGGTLGPKLGTRANLLLKHEICEWSRAMGKRFYLLGGGNSPDPQDPLFKYKRSYAPHGVRMLKVGRWMADPARYQRVLDARRAFDAAAGRMGRLRPGFFPAYRAPLDPLPEQSP